MSTPDIAQALQDLAESSKRDTERSIKQEANYEHLTKAMEDLTTSAAESAKATSVSMIALADKTGELTVAIKEIALNTNHLEERILREIDGLKASHVECASDRKEYITRFEALELKNSKAEGGIDVKERRRHFWITNWWKFLFVILAAIPFLDTILTIAKEGK